MKYFHCEEENESQISMALYIRLEFGTYVVNVTSLRGVIQFFGESKYKQWQETGLARTKIAEHLE